MTDIIAALNLATTFREYVQQCARAMLF